MKIKECIEAIDNAGGSLKIGNAKVTTDEGGIDFKIPNLALFAWTPNDADGDKEVSEELRFSSGVIAEIDTMIEIARFLGIPVGNIAPIERVVTTVDKAAEERLAGKVEAYEKILIGRSITASA